MESTIKLITAAVCLFLMTSCSNNNNDEAQTASVTVKVNGFAIEQTEFPTTRATAITDYNDVKFLTLAFYKVSDGSEAYKHTQARADNTTYTTFGEFSLPLPIGNYTMVVIANSGNNAVSLTSATAATYGENNVKDTFVATQAVNITSVAPVELSATLNRIVAAVVVQSTDNRPAGVTHMRFTYAKGGKAFNPSTGLATSDAGFVTTMAYSGNPGSTTTTGGYLFLASDEETMDVTIETLDAADGNVLFSKTITNVPLKRNRTTTLTGAVYSTAPVSANTFQVNNSWLNGNNIPF